MSLQTIYSSDEIDAVYLPGKSDFLLITFAALDFDSAVDPFWGRYFAEKAGLAAIGFVAKRNNWYPAKHIAAAVGSLSRVLQAFPRRITYGSSMGGYAAIKYSNLLGATACAAFGPQFSIDPSDGVTESAYTKYFDVSIHARMAINSDDVCGNPYLFFDPHEKFDASNAAFVRKVAPQTNLVTMPYTGHECIKAVAGIENARAVLSACLQADARVVRSTCRQLRAKSSARRAGLAGALIQKRSSLAFQIIDKYSNTMDQKLRAIFYDSAAAASVLEADFSKAEQYCLKALELLPDRTSFLRRLASVYQTSGQPDKALNYYNRYLDLNPVDPAILNAAAGLYLQLNDTERAEEFASKAFALTDSNLGVLRRLGEVRVRQGRYSEAESLLKRGLALDPTSTQICLDLSHVMSSQLDIEKAVDYAKLAIELSPNSKVAIKRLDELRAQ